MINDLEFVQRCVRSDKQAWDEFVDKYSRLIYNYIHSVLKTKGLSFSQENTNDIFQEIFVLLTRDNFKKLKSFKAKNDCSLASWLRQVTINYTIDYLRKAKGAISIDEENEEGLSLKDIIADNSAGTIDKVNKNEIIEHLKDCIEGLDADDKYFLELYLNRGLALDELKEHFRISRGAIDMRKSRIIDRLRGCFKKKGFQLDF